jgi:AcrR family transcriptional regulator
MDEKQDVRSRILNAAMERIKRYGYSKTTMAEIAADCGMSAGNIYRFFESKLDIAEAMARHHHAAQHQAFSALVRRKDVPVAQRLRDFFFTRMRVNFQLVEQDAKVLDVAEVLKLERPEYMNEEYALERVHLRALLEEGVAQGVFRAMDVAFVAEMLQTATVKFGFPQLFSKLPLAKLERELDGVLAILFSGLLVDAPPLPGARADSDSAPATAG